MSTDNNNTLQRANRRLAMKLGVLGLFALGFGFALVPLYSVICEVTGLNGKTGDSVAATKIAANAQAEQSAKVDKVDRSRLVTVEFTGTMMPGLAWEFKPHVTKMKVHPGEVVTAMFYAKNTSRHEVKGQAVPSMTPGIAAPHFQKLDCFCFTQQTLQPGQSKDLQIVFMVSPKLPQEVRTVTLGYAFFPAVDTEKSPEKVI